jgi:hypothetical protein
MKRGRKLNKEQEREQQPPTGRTSGRATRYQARPSEELDEVNDVDELDEANTGWQQTTAKMAGLTRLVTVGIWALLLAGPAIGLVAVAAGGSSASAPPATSTPKATQPSATGPAGFAELYLAAYISAGEGTEESLAPYYADPVTLANEPGSRTATRVVTVAAQPVSKGYWAVTVAAHVLAKDANGKTVDQGLRYYRVGVQVAGTPEAGGAAKPAKSDGGQALYAATSLPAEVNAPTAASHGDLGYGSDSGVSSNDPVADTVSRFIAAYLTSQGELGRYVSPGLQVTPIVPAPYTSTLVTSLRDDQEVESASDNESVPADGARRRVLATVSATSGDQDYTLNYALTLSTRDGRWEVAAFDIAPALSAEQTGPVAGSASPTPSPPPNPDTASPTAPAGN